MYIYFVFLGGWTLVDTPTTCYNFFPSETLQLIADEFQLPTESGRFRFQLLADEFQLQDRKLVFDDIILVVPITVVPI